MIPILLASSLAIATPNIQKDLTAPVQRLLDAPTRAPLSKDLQGRAPTPFDGKSPFVTKVLPPGAPLPPGAVLSLNKQELYAGRLCNKRVVQTAAPAPSTDPLAPKSVTPYAFKKLGDLPPGLLEHAVNRLVDGCPVREVVYKGQTYYLDMPVATLDRVDPASLRIKQR